MRAPPCLCGNRPHCDPEDLEAVAALQDELDAAFADAVWKERFHDEERRGGSRSLGTDRRRGGTRNSHWFIGSVVRRAASEQEAAEWQSRRETPESVVDEAVTA